MAIFRQYSTMSKLAVRVNHFVWMLLQWICLQWMYKLAAIDSGHPLCVDVAAMEVAAVDVAAVDVQTSSER